MPDGVRVLDCLDFATKFRVGDVLLDVAFLMMDLERLGRRDLVLASAPRFGVSLPRPARRRPERTCQGFWHLPDDIWIARCVGWCWWVDCPAPGSPRCLADCRTTWRWCGCAATRSARSGTASPTTNRPHRMPTALPPLARCPDIKEQNMTKPWEDPRSGPLVALDEAMKWDDDPAPILSRGRAPPARGREHG